MVVLSLEAAVAAVAVADPVKKIEEEIALLVVAAVVAALEMIKVKEAAFPVEVVSLEAVLMVKEVALFLVVKVDRVVIMKMKQLLDVVEMVVLMVKMGIEVKMVD